ncbi:GroES-like zinc-binding alcohol dehydrogenase family protein [Gossypium australe]|uniref:GroES-like zinc-binding alcohol dehydrogenase family protein n=1 Tax=Gossypium australe TaxID=47621 RepID=A0A5B6UFJ2_9ROSI|nr:GroES-like zinc-binding alcohol dehydrogenase family protein [Gossypium australe]
MRPLDSNVSGAKADNIIGGLGFQYSHRVEAIGYSGVFISFVYQSCNRQKHKDLWRDLSLLISLGQVPWMAIDNFNAILSPNEKSGGLSNGKRSPLFGDFVDMAELHYLGFRGPPFTWHRGGLFERLDRALGNEAWVREFSNCLVTHLHKIKSNHRPIFPSD